MLLLTTAIRLAISQYNIVIFNTVIGNFLWLCYLVCLRNNDKSFTWTKQINSIFVNSPNRTYRNGYKGLLKYKNCLRILRNLFRNLIWCTRYYNSKHYAAPPIVCYDYVVKWYNESRNVNKFLMIFCTKSNEIYPDLCYKFPSIRTNLRIWWQQTLICIITMLEP